MHRIFIDSFSLGISEEIPHHPSVDIYVDFLLKVNELKNNLVKQCYTLNGSRNCVALLAETDSLPTSKGSLFSSNRFQGKDINNIFFGILKNIRFIEDELGILDYLKETPSCSPNYFVNARPAIFQDDFFHISFFIHLFVYASHREKNSYTFITSNINNDYETATVRTQIIEMGVTDPNRYNVPLPIDIHYELHCYKNPLRSYSHIPVKDILSRENLKSGIELYCNQEFGDDYNWNRFPKTWNVHDLFWESISSLNILDDPKIVKPLLRACAETLLDKNLGDTHWLRKSKGANSPQLIRARDSAKAWRRDIGYDYHLHYWVTPNGPELASVVLHNNFSIPE